MISQIISTVSILAAIVIKGNLTTILLSYFLPLICTRFFFYRKEISTTERRNDLLTEETLSYGKHLTWASLPNVVGAQIDKILMWMFFGPAELAVYAISLAIPTQIQGLLKRAEILALPKLSSNRITNQNLLRKWFIFTLGTLPIAIIYILLAPMIFSTLFPQYVNAVLYSQILSVIIVLTPKTIIRSFLEARGASKKLYIFHSSTSVTKILLFLILVPNFGSFGAVLSIVINEIFSLLFIFFVLFLKIK